MGREAFQTYSGLKIGQTRRVGLGVEVGLSVCIWDCDIRVVTSTIACWGSWASTEFAEDIQHITAGIKIWNIQLKGAAD